MIVVDRLVKDFGDVRAVDDITLEIPAGEFLITRPQALLDGAAPQPPTNGLRFSGAGKRMTTILFRPPTGPGSCLCRNENIWSNLSFERIQFRSDGFAAVAEIMLRGMLSGYRVREVPMQLEVRRFGESKLKLGDAIVAHATLLTLTASLVAARRFRAAFAGPGIDH